MALKMQKWELDVMIENANKDRRLSSSSALGSAKNSAQPCYTTDQLFQGAKEILIKHGNEEYRLRITRHGKLILNK